MSSENIATVIKMMESLPEIAQEQLIDHLREYIENLRNEVEWDALVQKTQSQLIKTAKQARKEIAAGKGEPMNIDQINYST
ncbi:MAG TPA: hypothetical protein DCY91_13980 [Cyanobacteria bacterium UBA11370]|nr:hypothetical protein [Cyanobacteria bacterium UBA11370]